MMTRRGDRGFTLVELLIALAIVGALLTIAVGSLRVALAAWQQGEDRAEAHQHVRGVELIVARTVGATYPYRAPRGPAPTPVLLFRGTETRLEFVTQAPPFPFSIPIAFSAVVVSLEEGERAGLVVRQRALPNHDPFTDAAIVLHDPSVTALSFRYLDDGGAWRETWDGEAENAMPQAIRVAVGTTLGGRPQTLPPLTVSLRMTTP